MTGTRSEDTGCQRLLGELQQFLEDTSIEDDHPLSSHLRKCRTCRLLLAVARDVTAGFSATRRWIAEFHPQTLLRDTTKLLERAVAEHRFALARLYRELGRSYVYESHGDELKLIVLSRMLPRDDLIQEANSVLGGVRNLSATIADRSGAWVVEKSPLEAVGVEPSMSMVRAGGLFLEASLRLDPTCEDTRSWLGSFHEAIGWKKLAEDEFGRLGRVAANPMVRAMGLTNRYRNPGSPAELLNSLVATSQAVALFPTHPGAIVNVTLFSIIAGHLDHAYTSLSRLQELGPSDPNVQRAISIVLLTNNGAVFGAAKAKQRAFMRTLVRDFPSLFPEEFVERALPKPSASLGSQGQDGKRRRGEHFRMDGTSW
jgi:hypothetical protein